MKKEMFAVDLDKKKMIIHPFFPTKFCATCMGPGSLMNSLFLPLPVPPSPSYTDVEAPRGPQRPPKAPSPTFPWSLLGPLWTPHKNIFQNKAGGPEGPSVSPCHWGPPPHVPFPAACVHPRPRGLAHTVPSSRQQWPSCRLRLGHSWPPGLRSDTAFVESVPGSPLPMSALTAWSLPLWLGTFQKESCPLEDSAHSGDPASHGQEALENVVLSLGL